MQLILIIALSGPATKDYDPSPGKTYTKLIWPVAFGKAKDGDKKGVKDPAAHR
jgi:hypothetical protein